MATKPAAKTAAKAPAAPAKKTAPAKKAAAPAPAPEQEEVGDLPEIGSFVRFKGYGDDVPEDERVLEEGEAYEVSGHGEAEGDDTPGLIVSMVNPDFNPKKKESEDNPKTIETEVFLDEVDVLTDEEIAELDAEVADDTPAPAEEKPAAKAKGTAKAKAEAAAPAPAPKGKAKAETAPKGKAAAKKAAPKAEETPDEDELPDLENESEDVLAIVNEAGDDAEALVGAAQDLEQQIGQTEYQIGGILFHLRKGKKYQALAEKEEYSVKGGFGLFLADYFPGIGYRKAMALVDVYVSFSLAGIESPAEVVARIGYSKAAILAPALNEEGADVEDLVKLADETPAGDLRDAIKGQAEVGGTAGERVARVTLKFKYLAADAAFVTELLASVKEVNSLPDDREALLFILREYAQQAGGEATQEAAPATRAPAKKVAAKAKAKA